MRLSDYRTIRLIWLLLALLLASCNLSLAADITPPPDYRSPTPPPTLGPLYPAEPPNLERGRAIYAEKCQACHGVSGLGDGPQGKQLPVRVAALGLPEVARPARPDRWFTVVTQGNIERFMPPFMSLSAQERWDVVAYALTLHTSPQEVEEGRQIFERLCDACDTRIFRNQERMAALSDQDLFNWVTKGSAEFAALSGITDVDAWKVVAYLRSLSFAMTQAQVVSTPTQEMGTPATETPVSSVSETPVPSAGTPASATPAVSETPAVDMGTPASATEMPGSSSPATGPTESVTAPRSGQQVVWGVVEAAAGTQLPFPLQITLRGYDHEPNAMPVEKVTLTTSLNPDGSYRFEGVEMPSGRIFTAEVQVNGVRYVSPFATISEGQTELNLSPIRVYPVSEDFALLRITQTHVQVDVGEGQLQVFVVYSILNSGDQTVLVRTDGTSLPFLRFPPNATQTGIQLTQDSAPLLEADGGFAMPPSMDPYGFIAFYLLPYQNHRVEVEQPFVLASDSVILILPEGMEAKGEGIADAGTRVFQGNSFHLFQKGGVAAGSTLRFSISGKPRATSSASLPASQTIWIGVGALGVVLILLGIWFYWRERQSEAAEELEAIPYESEEEVLDAILALDDLHRDGKLSDEAYQKRRAELKAILEEMRGHD